MHFAHGSRTASLATAALVGMVASAFAATPTSSEVGALYSTAVAVWHFSGLQDGSGRHELQPTGEVAMRVPLSDTSRGESLLRGGDGAVAQFDGGYLDAGQGTGGTLNLKGSALTVYVRLRSPSGTWGGPLFSKYDGHERLVYNLFSSDSAIGFELGTQRTPGMTQVTVPVSLIGPTDWHDIVCRYDGAKLQMFADGVWVDEGFPMGPLREGNVAPCLIGAESVDGWVKSGWKGQMDQIALWDRALTDAEIIRLSGGEEAVAARQERYFGDLPSMQYYKPRDPFNVGDTLPFFQDGVFHFYYLRDRGHHGAKNGLGAHQWAHTSSTDLIHWQEHPLAIPITEESEGSICTGSMFFNEGTYYAFYATRGTDRNERLSLATGTNGIRFTKTEPNPFLRPGPRYGRGFRDPHVFRDTRSGLFHLIVSTTFRESGQACLAHYVSSDLRTWDETEPFLIEDRQEVPECPDTFVWNGRHYLVFSYGQVARYRVSDTPLGPWLKPRVEILDGGAARVIKTAAFTGNRRIATASLWPQGYAGYAVFRELIQNPDGTLGTSFVPEMIPQGGDPLPLQLLATVGGASVNGRSIRLDAQSERASAVLSPLPHNARIHLRVESSAEVLTLTLRAQDLDSPGIEIRILPGQQRVAVTGATQLSDVDGLDRPFDLDIILTERILDLSLSQQRTLVNWVGEAAGDRWVLSAEKGRAVCDVVEVRPLP